jgi:6-phosphogluconate dehydrogenase
MRAHEVGLIGLAVMGQNLALNTAGRGIRVAVFNRTGAVTEKFAKERIEDKPLTPFYCLDDFVASLERPRRIILMVKSGAPVDSLIDQLLPLVDEGDILADGGNSHFADTERRASRLSSLGIHYLGVGISGGEEGALRGPSIMPGGSQEGFDGFAALLEAISARGPDGVPCVAYLGPGGAGHFVKMVHNGIEYGVMQSIAEAYDLMRRGLGLPNRQLAEIFRMWNQGPMSSFFMEITEPILRKLDPETGTSLLENVLDQAEQKGTGRWAAASAFELGVPAPTITAAVEARSLSASKASREVASKLLSGPKPTSQGKEPEFIGAIGDALYSSLIIAYAQGFALLAAARQGFGYDIDPAEVSRVWGAGCIIRARLLAHIASSFREDSSFTNLINSKYFAAELGTCQPLWREALAWAVMIGIPVPAMSASLAYYDAYRSARLPADLTQAQRDCFGAHTYRRVDRPGVFHSDWLD